jgi:hypothetical protein
MVRRRGKRTAWASPFFAASAAGIHFLVMERQRAAGRLQVALGEPQEHLVRGQHDYRHGDVRYGLRAVLVECRAVKMY